MENIEILDDSIEKSSDRMDSDLLTTGQVAKLCGVTSDAVLKWIKRGRFPAIRTTGGHFRIARGTIEALGYCRAGDPHHAGGMPTRTGPAPTHCWEYFCRNLAPAETCKDCVVYRARIEKCYEVADLGERIGHNRQFCQATCQDCSFFRACKGLAASVLVATTDEALIGRLKAQAGSGRVVLQFARCGYECSTLVESFHPSVVVMDSGLPEVKDGRLVNSIMEDQRIPGVKVIIALRRGDQVTAPPGASVMSAPFTVRKIERLVQDYERPARSVVATNGLSASPTR